MSLPVAQGYQFLYVIEVREAKRTYETPNILANFLPQNGDLLKEPHELCSSSSTHRVHPIHAGNDNSVSMVCLNSEITSHTAFPSHTRESTLYSF